MEINPFLVSNFIFNGVVEFGDARLGNVM